MSKQTDLRPMTPMTYCDRLATTRWGSYIARVEGAALREALSSQTAGEALEIGCEGGRLSVTLAQAGWRMTCVDVDAASLAVCRSRLPSARCILASDHDTTLPCADNSMNLILCMEVWPVIDSDWFLPEAHRVLSPNGLLVGAIMNRRSFRGLFVRARERHDKPRGPAGFTHYRHAYPSWTRELTRRGFTLRYERGYCWFPFQRDSNSRMIPLTTFAEGALGLRRLPSWSPYIVFIARKDG
jgi:SAM-dependent methyltransferase